MALTQQALNEQHKALPLVQIKEPYQKGWKRSFIVREDVKRSGSATFYAELLKKINTVEYSADKTFKARRLRKHRYIYQLREQSLRAFTVAEWAHPKLKITEKEKPHFHFRYVWNALQNVWHERYIFKESWRYVLQVKPNIITHTKLLDNVLEQQIQQLENHITHHHLRPRMNKVFGLPTSSYWRIKNGNPRYKSDYKNKPLHALLGECCDEQPTI